MKRRLSGEIQHKYNLKDTSNLKRDAADDAHVDDLNGLTT